MTVVLPLSGKVRPHRFFVLEGDIMKVAVLVDGGFYRKQAKRLFGEKTPEERATELIDYCKSHLYGPDSAHNDKIILYRIFYYDCPPLSKNIYKNA